MPQALTPAPGAASRRFPRVGLSSGLRNQPSEAASGRLGPPVRSSPWTPASGDGRGPRRPPPRQLRLGRRHCAPPATPAPDLPVGESGVPGQRPRARGRAPRRPEPVPGTQSIRGEAGRGETPADCRGSARPVAGVAGTWLSLSTGTPLPPPPFCLPLGFAAAVLRGRFPGCGHFPASLARGQGTGGFYPPGGGERSRRLRPPLLRRSPAPLRVFERRPRRPRMVLPRRPARARRSGFLPSKAHSFISNSRFFQLSSFSERI